MDHQRRCQERSACPPTELTAHTAVLKLSRGQLPIIAGSLLWARARPFGMILTEMKFSAFSAQPLRSVRSKALTKQRQNSSASAKFPRCAVSAPPPPSASLQYFHI